MQSQRAGRLRRPHPFQAVPVQGGHNLVVDYGGTVDHPAQHQPGLLGGRHQSFGYPRCGDVAADDPDLSLLLQVGQHSALLV